MRNADRSNPSPRIIEPAVPLFAAEPQRVAARTLQSVHSLEAELEMQRRNDAMREEPERWDGMS
jgi:hypothetical protein